MSVKTALALINRVWGEIENDLDANFDPETQVALAWFATYGFDARASGELISTRERQEHPDRGAVPLWRVPEHATARRALTPRAELPEDWSPRHGQDA